MNNKFGWSYPAGAENDPFAPYNQTDDVSDWDGEPPVPPGGTLDEETYFHGDDCVPKRERDELRARATWLETGLERKTQELQTAMAEVERLRQAWADSEAACLIQVKMVRAEN